MRAAWTKKAIATLMLAAGLTAPAWADVWGYVDEAGTTHFAKTQLDARYQLYFKTDTAAATLPAAHMPAGKVGKVTLGHGGFAAFNPLADAAAGTKAQRLVALMNQSKAYRLVSATLLREATRHALDHDLVKAIAAAESGFNTHAVSPVGAVGLMQIMPDTARMLGLRDDAQQSVEQKLTDAATNARLGTRYLRQLLNRFGGRTDLAVAAYNAGPGAVSKRMAVPPYAETQDYVRTVLAIYQTLQPGAAPLAAYAGEAASPARSNGRRMRLTLAGSRAAPATAAEQSAPAQISLSAGAALPQGPTALDTVASKIAAADSSVAPELGQDVVVRPAAAP